MARASVLDIAGRRVGGDHFTMIAGPCTIESREQTLVTAHTVAAAGATMFRGGAYKPRTSPYAFQGLGQEGLRLLAEAKAQTGLPIVTEVMDARDLEPVLEVADVVQIGARNMQNYTLLSEIGRSGCPALIKRGLSSTLEELLMAAEYVLKEGNEAVILCERGIRTFETAYRFTLDLMAIPVLKEMTHLPVIVDPSHAAGRRDLVGPMSLAAAAAGADGLIVEVHPNPDEAICDAAQQLVADEFPEYLDRVRAAAAVAGKALWEQPVAGRRLRRRCSSPMTFTDATGALGLGPRSPDRAAGAAGGAAGPDRGAPAHRCPRRRPAARPLRGAGDP